MAKNEAQKSDGVKFVSPVFRLSFPHLFEPRAFERNGKPQGDPKYSLVGLIPKKAKKDSKLGDLTPYEFMTRKLRQAAAECWGKDPKQWPTIQWPWKDGDADDIEYNGYEGHWYFSADTKNPPGVVDRSREDIIKPNAIYAGCYCRAELVAKAVEQVAKKDWVKFYLQHVMFWEEGEKLGGGGNARDAFEEVAEDGDDDVADDDSWLDEDNNDVPF